ncbi:ensconsin-like isoform X3 [Pomacea canaliculata]|uniref:ensconsin-like isoform X3 n=1 Tax=Pomacea canaliculata TaxID=400727 RepID=UPI000D730FA1|nr:ensconsin-like isoform X3 [Pomacea canaliculata]
MADSSKSEGLNNEEHASSSPRHSTPRSRKQGMTTNSNMNARSSPGLQDVSTDGISSRDGGGDDSGPSPSKMRSPHPRSSGVGATDTQSVDTRLSGVSGESDSHTQSAVSISPKHKDPDRIKKDREREERVRLARERLEEERKKKLVELQEQQRQAQENREKQLEMRRQKIEDLRRRDIERRAAVEERRRAKEDADRSRRETLLIKAEERVARYEQWRRTGQKGGRSHCLGFGSATPRAVCQPMERPRRSSSHSALMRRSPNGSDSDYSFRPQRRALSACSTIRRHCCVDINRMGSMPTPKHLSVSTSVLYHKRNTDFSSAGMLNISSRPESLVALNTIPEGRRSFLAAMGQLPSRPKSVMTLSGSSTGSASSVVPGGGVRLRETKTPRKPRPASVATSMPSFVAFEPARPSPRSKSSDRLARERSKTRVKSARQSAEKEDEKVEEGKEMVKTVVKTSRGTIDRLSTPKQSPSAQGKETATAKRESPVRISPRKAFSTSNLTVPRKKPSIKERPTKEASGKPKHPTPAAVAAAALEDASPPAPVVASTSAATATPTSASATRTPTRVQSPVLAADEDGGSGRPLQTATPGSAGEITAEEYKAKLAEKRRQAREKAEREAEEERRRQEEIQRQEEERRRQEEEDQRRLEEEALRLAEEGRKAEEERLRKAIEAEEQRRAEEAARLEQERLAKEESERKAKEEAERLEQEKLEKSRRDEEERLERKKRLEMIMKRVKTDAPVEGTKETPIKTVTGSPTKNMSSNSSDSSPTEPESKGMPEASPAPSVKQDEAEPRSENIESEESQPLVSASLPEEHTQAPHTKEPDSATVSFIEEEKAEPSVLAQNSMMFSAMYSPVAASVEADNGVRNPSLNLLFCKSWWKVRKMLESDRRVAELDSSLLYCKTCWARQKSERE